MSETINENADPSVQRYISEFRETYPADYEMALKFADCRILVKMNKGALLDALMKYFDNFLIPLESNDHDITITAHEAPSPDFPVEFIVKQPDPGKTKIKEAYVDLDDGRMVKKRLTGMHFLFGRGEHLAIGPCMENSNQVINFINNRYIEWELCNGALLGHAAAVSWRGRGAAAAGFSGAGKSTFALHMMNLGTTFVSNDRLMIRQNRDEADAKLTMYGVAKLPRINPGTILNNPSLLKIMSDEEIRIFSDLPKHELWELEHKYDASIDDCFGPDKFVLDAPMVALAILNWKHVDAPLKVEIVDPQERKDLLPAFMKSTGLFFTPESGCNMPKPTAQAYADYLSNCTVIEFSGGIQFEKAAEIYLHFLEHGALPA